MILNELLTDSGSLKSAIILPDKLVDLCALRMREFLQEGYCPLVLLWLDERLVYSYDTPIGRLSIFMVADLILDGKNTFMISY